MTLKRGVKYLDLARVAGFSDIFVEARRRGHLNSDIS